MFRQAPRDADEDMSQKRIFNAAKENDVYEMAYLYLNGDHTTVWNMIRTNNNFRKSLIAVTITHQAIDILEYFISKGIFTHADYEEYASVANKIRCQNELMLTTSNIPQDINNLLNDHIKIIESVSYPFTLQLFSSYAKPLLTENFNVTHFKQLVNDSRVCMTTGDQVEFVRTCQTICCSAIEDRIRTIDYYINLIKINSALKTNIIDVIHKTYAFKQMIDIIFSDNRLTATKEQIKTVNNFKSMGNLIEVLMENAYKQLVEFAQHYIIYSKNPCDSFGFYNNSQPAIEFKEILKKIASDLPETNNIIDTVIYLFNSLNAAYKEHQANASHLKNLIHSGLLNFVEKGICDMAHGPAVFTLSNAFKTFKMMVDEKQQQLNQVEDKKPQKKT